MAVLGVGDLSGIRQECSRSATDVNYTKAQINAALQAIEDWFENNRTGLGIAINVATAPLVLTAAQKRILIANWLKSKFERER